MSKFTIDKSHFITGGWGKIQYAIKQLILIGVAKEKLVTVTTKSQKLRVLAEDEIDGPDNQCLEGWIKMLEKFDVFFSGPLDIDFLMLQYYKDYYLEILSKNEGPIISYNDSDGNSRKVKLSDLNKSDQLQLEGFEKRIEEAKRATLKDKSGPGDSFTDEEKELMIWYQYFFLGRGKPTTHMQFLSSISDNELKRNLPPVFEKMVRRAEELLGDIDYGEE